MGNMIELDITLVIQLVNFLITIVALNYLLIKPVRNQITARSALISEYTGIIEEFNAKASKKLATYETALAEARKEAALTREHIKTHGIEAEKEMIEAANANAQAFLESSREDSARNAKAAMNSLLSQVDGFASKAMSKILG